MHSMVSSKISAVVTAGGRLSPEWAAASGVTVKALLPIGGETLLRQVISALRGSPCVGRIVVVGPVSEIEPEARAAGADDVLPEAATGPENTLIGLRAVKDVAGNNLTLLAASDLWGLDSEAVTQLLARAQNDEGDILFPVIVRAVYDARFPGSPNVWTPMDGNEYTGGSVMLLRPAAIERNRELIERVFDSRKSQIAMARLLGLSFALKFLFRRLTIPDVEARASVITGCVCRALLDSDARLAADINNQADYEYALRQSAAIAPDDGGKG